MVGGKIYLAAILSVDVVVGCVCLTPYVAFITVLAALKSLNYSTAGILVAVVHNTVDSYDN